MRIFYFIWVGNGPFFVAQEKGLFAKEGVEVELINIEDHAAIFAGLFAGQVDAITAGTQDVLTFSEPDEELWCACFRSTNPWRRWHPGHQRHPGRRRSQGQIGGGPARSLQQFYLNVLLREAGLSEADIEVVDLPFDDAAEAFMMQEVDAAVTYEPWLTPGKRPSMVTCSPIVRSSLD